MITTQDFFPHTSRRGAPHETTSFTLAGKGLRIMDCIGLRAISSSLQSYWGRAKSVKQIVLRNKSFFKLLLQQCTDF